MIPALFALTFIAGWVGRGMRDRARQHDQLNIDMALTRSARK